MFVLIIHLIWLIVFPTWKKINLILPEIAFCFDCRGVTKSYAGKGCFSCCKCHMYISYGGLQNRKTRNIPISFSTSISRRCRHLEREKKTGRRVWDNPLMTMCPVTAAFGQHLGVECTQNTFINRHARIHAFTHVRTLQHALSECANLQRRRAFLLLRSANQGTNFQGQPPCTRVRFRSHLCTHPIGWPKVIWVGGPISVGAGVCIGARCACACAYMAVGINLPWKWKCAASLHVCIGMTPQAGE